ncbi:AraC family transcriptional regulator [Nitrogeniibacter aestuarii]|uniref:AraC family transcriptional regulator n=1 Tax=Nitrogeniibacter aestuarii TaxID=2815343 RepID=UPI001E42C6C3|nr:AraC family transcriptional regulator [Nitrogeniibacter aestuarii]
MAETVPHRPEMQAKILRSIFNAVGLGIDDQAALLAGEGLSIGEIQDVSAHIPMVAYMRIFERLAQQRNDPTLGLTLSSRMGPELIGATGYIFMHSPDLEAAIRAYSETVFDIQEATSLRFQPGPSALVIYTITDDDIRPRRQDVEFSLGYLHTLIKAYLGGRYAPKAVYFDHSHAPGRNNHDAFFGCPVFFGQDMNALVLHGADLRRGAENFDPNLIALLQHYIQLVGERSYPVSTLSESINQMLSGMIERQSVDIALVATRLGLSETTLRRRLKQEGTTFRDLLRQKRIATARRLLFETDMSMLQVADKIGYAETASFTRAFITECGLTPSQYRREARSV